MGNNIELDAGSSKSAGQIMASFDPRLRDPARLIVRALGYLLVLFVVYLISIGVLTSKVNSILIWAGIYFTYLITLELIRRFRAYHYDNKIFHFLRIFINLGMITWLINLSPEFDYLIGFFYLIPIFAGIVYFADNLWIGIATFGISVFSIILSGQSISPNDQNAIRLILLITGITFFSISVFWLYHRAIKSTSQFSTIIWDLHRTLDIYKLIKRTSDNAIQITNATHSLVIIIDPLTGRYVNHIAVGFMLRPNKSIEDVAKECRVLLYKKPFDCPDISTVFRENNIYSKFFLYQPKSVLAEPLFDSEGRIIGVLNVAHNDVDHFNGLVKTQLKEFSGAVSTTIANCLSNRKARLNEAKNIEEGDRFNTSSTEEEIFESLKIKLTEKFNNAHGIVIHILDTVSENLLPIYATESGFNKLRQGDYSPALRFGVGIAGHALQINEPVLVDDAINHPWYTHPINETKIASLISSPIVSPDGKIQYGAVTLYSIEKNAWKLQDEVDLTSLSFQTALALTRVKRLVELKEKGSILKGISDEIRNFELRGGEESLYKKITTAAVNTLDFGVARLRILDEKTGNLLTKAMSGINDETYEWILKNQPPLPLTIISSFLSSKYRVEQSFIVHHDDYAWQEIAKKYFYIPEIMLNKQVGWRAYSALLTPLTGQNEQIIGLLSLDMPKDGLFPSPEALEAIGVFTSAAAWALELAQAQTKINEQRQRSWALLESLGPKLASIRDFDSLGELIVQFGTQIINAEGCSLHIVHDNELELTHSSFLAGTRYINKKKRISKANNSGLSCWVAATGEELCFEEERHKKHPAWAGEEEHLIYLESGYCHSLLIVPVKSLDGKILAVLTLENKKSSLGVKNFDDDDKTRIRVLASKFSQALDMMGKYELIQKWERKGIEDELHDIINWYHSGVVLSLDAVAEWFRRKKYSKVKKELPLILRRAYTSVNELKTVHTDLAKPPIKGLSLKKELERVISDWTNRATPHYAEPIKVYLSCSEEIRLPELIQNTIARITSGAVANSILHSKIITDPKISINIKVHKNENTIILIVSDNGNGKKHIREGYGITRMRQLTDLLVKKYKVTYANFSIISDPNNGTSVSVEISIPENLSLLA